MIQRRLPNGTVDFVRNLADYENGFGDLNGEFWYGLRNIQALTTQKEVELRIDMARESDDFEFHWTYQTFRVAGASDEYQLTIGEAEGSYGTDAMAYHNNQLMTVTMISILTVVHFSSKEDGGTTVVIMLISMALTHR